MAYNLHEQSLNFDTKKLETIISNEGNTNIFEFFVQRKYRVYENMDINSGQHYTYMALNNNYTIEPRLGKKWDINKTRQINLGAGLYSKVEPVSTYLAEQELENGSRVIPNIDLHPTKAAHIVLGYNLKFAKDL